MFGESQSRPKTGSDLCRFSIAMKSWPELFGRDTAGWPDPIGADLWLDSQNVGTSAQIWVQSTAPPSYSTVLTLLWIKERVEIYAAYDEDALEELDPEQFTTNRRRGPR